MKTQKAITGGVNILTFLFCVPYINKINGSLMNKLAERFCMNPNTLALLINISVKGGGVYEN